jgi:hypothetical protein
MALGQLTHLPASVADNPFHPFFTQFSRYKAASFEVLFTLEALLLRYSWVGLIVLLLLVVAPLDEVPIAAGLVRLATVLYPCFFIWSLTRLAGVELLQLVLDGHWTPELLATPISNREYAHGFILPVGLVVRQYLLISIFSLFLYGFEANGNLIMQDDDDGSWYYGEFVRLTLFNFGLFFGSVTWTIFVYLGRMYAEIRLRNGLLKGLATVSLFAIGALLFIAYCSLFFFYPGLTTSTPVLAALALMTASLVGFSMLLYSRLRRYFRDYLTGQLDLDVLIYDQLDPHTSAWQEVTRA